MHEPILIEPEPPYSFALLVDFLGRHPHPSGFKVSGKTLFYVLGSGDQSALIKVTGSDSRYEPRLEIQQVAGNLNPEISTKRIEHCLGFHANLAEYYEFARRYPELWETVRPLYGMPLVRSEALYHALLFTIIEQQISWISARLAQRQLLIRANHTLRHQDLILYAMPTPDQIAAASLDDLKPLKITFKRMQLLIDLSQQIVQGSLNLKEMQELEPEELYRSLIQIKGIGHWTAAVVVARFLGKYPYITHNDVALQAAVQRYFGVEKSAQSVQDTLGRYQPYAGLSGHLTLIRWVLDEYPHEDFSS